MLDKSVLPSMNVIILCLPWYILSSIENVVNKLFLEYHPFPVTISVSHMITHVMFLYPSLRLLGVAPKMSILSRETLSYFVPLAMLKLLVSIMSHASITFLAVSYANTIKTSMPLLTLVLSKKILNKRHSIWELFSMICIITGVFVATVTEVSFNTGGLVCILLAMLASAGESFLSKLALINTNVPPMSMLVYIHVIAFVLIQPIWFGLEASLIHEDVTGNKDFDLVYFIVMLILTGITSLGQHILKILLVSRTSPVSYSMASSAKSVLVIIVSLLLLRNPVTAWNMTGTCFALCGLVVYQKMKVKEN